MIYLNARIKPNYENLSSELVLFKYDYNNLTFCNYKSNYKNHTSKKFIDYKFNNVFDEKDKNLKIYLNIILPSIYKPSYFILYGYTNSGKTHTLFGNDSEPGIIDYIANKLQYVFSISAIELSHSGLKDLLNNFKNLYCYASDKSTTKYVIKNKKFEEISNVSEYKKLISKIKLNRVTRKTKKNSSSSRSHLIITLRYLDNEIYLIDLAGNENKPKFTNASEILETGFINSSLMALKECVRKKKAKQKYIPYRNNLLTKIVSEIFVKDDFIVNFLFTFNSNNKFKSQIVDTLNFYKNLLDVNIFPKIKNEITKSPKIIKKYHYSKILKPTKIEDIKQNIKLKPIVNSYSKIYKKDISINPPPPSIKIDVNKILSPEIFKDKKKIVKNDNSSPKEDKKIDLKLYNPFEISDKNPQLKKFFDNSDFKKDFISKNNYSIYNKRKEEKAKNKVELVSNLLYRRAIKNFVKLNLLKKKYSESVNNQIISETIATLEVILDELNKL